MLELVAPFLIAAVGALVVWYADACRRGTVRRQRILGYRTALTMRDPKAWFTAPWSRCSTSLVAVPFSPDWRAGCWR